MHEPFVLTVVVNGDSVHPVVTPRTLLSEVVAQSLILGKVVGRAEDQWLLKTETATLSLGLTIEAAHVKSGDTLFLSLALGAAGEVLVDPAVSRQKFDAEVAKYRGVADKMEARGQWMTRAEFPEVTVVFASPLRNAPPIVAFGAVLNFENFDLWAPSVRIVDPFTRKPYIQAELPSHAHLNRLVKVGETAPDGSQQVGLQALMQAHAPTDVPFLCIPGVREYHLHPAHTGDDWLLRRGSVDGTLYHLLDVLYEYGVRHIVGLQPAMQYQLPA